MPRKEVADKMTFRAVFTKEGNTWTVIAPDAHPAHSWGPSLESSAQHIKEAIALVLDLPKGSEQSIALDPEYTIEGMEAEESDIFREAREARQNLHSAQNEAEETLRKAVDEGRKGGLSIRDIASMTGVSYQRVAQISSRSRV